MRIEKCWFCSSNIYPGHGVTFVRNDAKTFRFCRPKCHRHFKAKRNPLKMKWTKAYRKLHNKELTYDKTFEFEKRRNTPAKYSRDLVIKTMKAMKRIEELRSVRKMRYYKKRMNRAARRHKHLFEATLSRHETLLKGVNPPTFEGELNDILKEEESHMSAEKSEQKRILKESKNSVRMKDVIMN